MNLILTHIPLSISNLSNNRTRAGGNRCFVDASVKSGHDFNRVFWKITFASKTRTCHLLTVAVTTQLWYEWYQIWEAHNLVVHGHDTSTCNIIKRKWAVLEIPILYSSKWDQLLPLDHDFLFPTLAEHVTRSTTQLANYWPFFHRSFRWTKQAAANIRDLLTCLRQDTVP